MIPLMLLGGLAPLGPGLLACSFGVTPFTPCESSLDCRDAFGFGNRCGETGYCEPVVLEERCDATYPDDLFLYPESYTDVNVLGSLYDHTTDTPERLSTRLAVKQADDSQGLDGTPFALVQCSYEEDSQLDPLASDESASAMARHLVEDLGAYAIVGPATSGVTEAVWTEVGALGPLIISPSATSPALTYLDQLLREEGHAGRLWRTAPPDSVQGQVLAQLVADALDDREIRSQSVALVYQVGPYGEGLAEVFAGEYENDERTATRYLFEDDTGRDNAVNSVATGNFDAILFITSDLPDDVAFLNAAAARDEFDDMPIFLADAAKDSELLTGTTSASALWPNITGTAPAVPAGNVYDAFAASYAAEYTGQSAADSSYSAYAYDAAWLAEYGAAWSLAVKGVVDGQGAADGLRQVSNPSVSEEDQIPIAPANWAEVRASFAAGEPINVVGASGSLDYDFETEETVGPIDVWKIAGADFETVDTISP